MRVNYGINHTKMDRDLIIFSYYEDGQELVNLVFRLQTSFFRVHKIVWDQITVILVLVGTKIVIFIYIYIYIYVFAVGWTCSFLLVNSADSARFNPHFWLVLLTVGRVRLVARNSLQTHGYGFLKGSHRKKKNTTIPSIICFPISQQIQDGKELTTKRQTFHSEDLWLSGLPSLVDTCAYNVVPPQL